MFLIRRILRSGARRVAQSVAVALIALTIGALPMAGGAVAEAGSSGDAYGIEDCQFSHGI